MSPLCDECKDEAEVQGSSCSCCGKVKRNVEFDLSKPVNGFELLLSFLLVIAIGAHFVPLWFAVGATTVLYAVHLFLTLRWNDTL